MYVLFKFIHNKDNRLEDAIVELFLTFFFAFAFAFEFAFAFAPFNFWTRNLIGDKQRAYIWNQSLRLLIILQSEH